MHNFAPFDTQLSDDMKKQLSDLISNFLKTSNNTEEQTNIVHELFLKLNEKTDIAPYANSIMKYVNESNISTELREKICDYISKEMINYIISLGVEMFPKPYSPFFQYTQNVHSLYTYDAVRYLASWAMDNYNPETVEISIYFPNKNDSYEIKSIKTGDWIDLQTTEDVNIKQGEIKLISLGFSMKLPKGYEAILAPRSSTAMRYGILMANSIGIIDESYCGPDDIWKFAAYAIKDTEIPAGTRICQFRLFKHQPKLIMHEVDELHTENRNGFGSTGL